FLIFNQFDKLLSVDFFIYQGENMQIHIIDIHYLDTQEEIAKVRPLHRDLLDIGYNKGIFIESGPKK
ncbi:hypothetical protein, partial [Francisella tularensis]|uniref:hypothetical protein n=1 Tax=Francisella tularensis TaxID=263 RepID=UPI002381AFBB